MRLSALPLPALLCLLLALAAPARAGEAVLRAADLVPVGAAGWIAPGLALPAPDPGLPTVDPGATDPALVQLRGLAARRRAAGFEGVLYDNRDRGHSALPERLFPRLGRLAWAPELAALGLDYGLGGAVLVPAIVIGNSSTAIREGPLPRSLPRLAMTAPGGPTQAFRAYAANHLYVHPEHRDHDAADLFPAAWPYMVVSQGSSGSDQPFLRALLATLAAFPPETRARLSREGLAAATLQMILRRSLAPVRRPEDYLTGAAHPSAFDAAALRPQAMVAMAAAMRPGEVSPLVRLEVEAEDFLPEAGLGRLSERLFDTPAAVARVFRGPDWEKSMTVSATAGGGGGDGFAWRLLRGDPARVRIEPLDPGGRRARITVAWHEAFPGAGTAEDGAPRLTSRVDIGVFARAGTGWSAPAFVSVSFPAHEARRYGPGPGGAMRLLEADYDALGRGAAYDPALHWSAPWRDRFSYAPDGSLAGVERLAREGAAAPPPGRPLEIDRSRPRRPVLAPAGE